MAKLTPEASRAGRALLKWSIRELADNADLAFSTVFKFEDTGKGSKKTQKKIKSALEKWGVLITNREGTGAKIARGMRGAAAAHGAAKGIVDNDGTVVKDQISQLSEIAGRGATSSSVTVTPVGGDTPTERHVIFDLEAFSRIIETEVENGESAQCAVDAAITEAIGALILGVFIPGVKRAADELLSTDENSKRSVDIGLELLEIGQPGNLL